MFSCPLEDAATPAPGLGIYSLPSPSPGPWVTTATTRASSPGEETEARTLPTDQGPENRPQRSGANRRGRPRGLPAAGKESRAGRRPPHPAPPRRWPLGRWGQLGAGSGLSALRVILMLSQGPHAGPWTENVRVLRFNETDSIPVSILTKEKYQCT